MEKEMTFPTAGVELKYLLVVSDSARSLKDSLKAVEGELINLTSDKPRPGTNRVKEKFEALSGMIDEAEAVTPEKRWISDHRFRFQMTTDRAIEPLL